MLVPSEDSNMDNERLARAHRTEGAMSAPAATASSRPPVTDSTLTSILWRLPQAGAVRNLVPHLTWRNMHHLHSIRAFDATSRSAKLASYAGARPQPACHAGRAACGRQRCARGQTAAAQSVG